MTYPAQEVDRTVVTGMMSPQFDERCVYPPSIFEEIQNRISEYDIGLKWSDYIDREEDFLTNLESRLEVRRELMRYLMEIDDWELFFFVYTEPDRLQHLIWDDDVLLSHYQRLDDILGEVLEYISNRDANLFVVSDHGFGPISKFICVNSILESNGYLRRKENKNGDEIASTRIRGASVYDITPTILYSLGKPIQEHTDGQVLDVFEPSSRPAKAEITKKRYVTTEMETDYDEDFTEVEERLRGLRFHTFPQGWLSKRTLDLLNRSITGTTLLKERNDIEYIVPAKAYEYITSKSPVWEPAGSGSSHRSISVIGLSNSSTGGRENT